MHPYAAYGAYAVAQEPRLDAADLARVRAGLVGADPPDVGPRGYAPLVLTLRGADGALAGALLGATIWGWLHVDELWVAAPLRRGGLGRRLLAAAEAEAAARGCRHARLDTFDFQARAFYERCGYAVYARLDGFPPGHAQFHMRKALAADGAG